MPRYGRNFEPSSGPMTAIFQEIRRFFLGQADEPQAVLVAELPSQGVVGFVELSIRSSVAGCSLDRVGYIEGLYVVPGARHQGVARALVKASLAWARAGGLPRVRLRSGGARHRLSQVLAGQPLLLTIGAAVTSFFELSSAVVLGHQFP